MTPASPTLQAVASDPLVEEVRRLLGDGLRTEIGEIFEFRRPSPEERPSGILARADFRGVEVAERFKTVYGRLREALGERANEVGLIFVFTPEEFADYDEDRNSP